MQPDKKLKEPYLFGVMNLHPEAGTDVEEALWKALPRMSAYRKLELELLEELLEQFIRRIIRIADSTLLTFLSCTEEDNECEELIDSFLDLAMREMDELQSLFLQPLLLRLTRGYADWVIKKPIASAGRNSHAAG